MIYSSAHIFVKEVCKLHNIWIPKDGRIKKYIVASIRDNKSYGSYFSLKWTFVFIPIEEQEENCFIESMNGKLINLKVLHGVSTEMWGKNESISGTALVLFYQRVQILKVSFVLLPSFLFSPLKLSWLTYNAVPLSSLFATAILLQRLYVFWIWAFCPSKFQSLSLI